MFYQGQSVVVRFRSGKTFRGGISIGEYDNPTPPYFYLHVGDDDLYMIPWASVEWVKAHEPDEEDQT